MYNFKPYCFINQLNEYTHQYSLEIDEKVVLLLLNINGDNNVPSNYQIGNCDLIPANSKEIQLSYL